MTDEPSGQTGLRAWAEGDAPLLHRLLGDADSLTLMVIGAPRAAACFGASPLTLTGYSSDCGGCGGVPAWRPDPSWIAAPFAPWFVTPERQAADGSGERMPAWPAPSLSGDPPATDTPIRITGHFNDPVSPSCRIVPLFVGIELRRPPTRRLPAAEPSW